MSRTTLERGGLAEMDAMFPYLFARPTTLVTMDACASVDRAEGNPLGDARLRQVSASADVVRREHHVEPHPTETRLQDAAVFVLTSGATGSGAEHLTLALKRTGRATIIGEPAEPAIMGACVPWASILPPSFRSTAPSIRIRAKIGKATASRPTWRCRLRPPSPRR